MNATTRTIVLASIVETKRSAAKWIAGNILDLALAAFFLAVALLFGSR